MHLPEMQKSLLTKWDPNQFVLVYDTGNGKEVEILIGPTKESGSHKLVFYTKKEAEDAIKQWFNPVDFVNLRPAQLLRIK